MSRSYTSRSLRRPAAWTTVVLMAFLVAWVALPAGTSASSNGKPTWRNRPDLTVTSMTLSSADLRQGTTLTISVTVKNVGMASADASALGLYLASSPDAQATAMISLASVAVSSLGAGASVGLIVGVIVPSVSPGSYYAVALVDPGNSLREALETNNRRAVQVSLSTPTPSGSLRVWVVDSLRRVQRAEPPGTMMAASISAARNEYEAFQVVVRAPDDTDLAAVVVAVSDLTGPITLSRSHVALYRAHYVPVRQRSTHPTNGWSSPYPPGDWPDALVPASVPGATYPSFPFPLAAGRNQPVWIEVYVPPTTPPGTYTGTVTVSALNLPPLTLPLTLTVWGFTLPDRPALASEFGVYDRWFALASLYSTGSNQQALLRNLYAALDAHRLGLGEATVRTTEDRAFLDAWMPSHRWIRAQWNATDAELRDLKTYFSARGWGDFLGHYIADEPQTASDYAAIQAEAPRWHTAGIPTMTTIKTDSAWSALDGAIDIWVPVFYECLASLPQIQAKLAQGHQVWSYTAGVQPNEAPTWLLDYDLIHFRIPAWLNYRHGQTGLLYWATAYWAAGDPWTNAANENGDGVLFYPGAAVGAPNAAIPSLRLKAIRDGMEDYDYLALLATLGDPALAAQLARTLAPSWDTWSHDPAALATAREQAATRILQLGAPGELKMLPRMIREESIPPGATGIITAARAGDGRVAQPFGFRRH